MSIDGLPFDFTCIRQAISSGQLTPNAILAEAYRRIRADGRPGVWISLKQEADAEAELAQKAMRPPNEVPLLGLPFAVKDNIDAAGLATTAACPAFTYFPQRSAHTVARLEAAGAVCVGKTNLDQFATGLNGTRSPYGACGAAADPRFVAGGSSSGSGVAVALHQVAFSLGTDTGGSGRIPAGLNNIIGLKPTVGILSTAGVVANCRTLDCVSVFALNIADALEVAAVAFDPTIDEPWLRPGAAAASFTSGRLPEGLRLAVPRIDERPFFGNADGAALYAARLKDLGQRGAQLEEIAFAPFAEAGAMMFDGPWIAERAAAFGGFVATHPGAALPVIEHLLKRAKTFDSCDLFTAMYRLRELQLVARDLFARCHALVLPTVAPLYTIAEMEADPIVRNTHHGYYSYHANMLDLAALAIPAGHHANGMPFGITLFAPAFADGLLAAIGSWAMGNNSGQLGISRPTSRD